MWVEFVVGSLPCSEKFFSGYSGFPLSSKTNISKFQFDQESGKRRTTMWMCYLQIVIYLLFYLFIYYFKITTNMEKETNKHSNPHKQVRWQENRARAPTRFQPVQCLKLLDIIRSTKIGPEKKMIKYKDVERMCYRCIKAADKNSTWSYSDHIVTIFQTVEH